MRHIFLVVFIVCFCGCGPTRSEIDTHLDSLTLEDLQSYDPPGLYAEQRRNELYWHKAKQAYSFDFAVGDLVQSKVGEYQGIVLARDVHLPTNSYGTPPPAKLCECYRVKFAACGQSQNGHIFGSADSEPALFAREWVCRYEITAMPAEPNDTINP